ncbi:MAG: NTPase [candidate division Zixibacteria bacterium]|nr:NTPase [candidate division Zixibacteria bacterium]
MSARSKPKILLTGTPGCGKTTLINRVVKKLNRPVRGFFTSEIRKKGTRVGFEVETFSQPSRRGILSRIDIKSRHRVGKYGVDIETFEDIVLPEVRIGMQMNSLIVIDEIGKMELFSSRFKDMLANLFESDTALLATILVKPHPFCDKLKSCDDVELITVDRGNRDKLVEEIVSKLG